MVENGAVVKKAPLAALTLCAAAGLLAAACGLGTSGLEGSDDAGVTQGADAGLDATTDTGPVTGDSATSDGGKVDAPTDVQAHDVAHDAPQTDAPTDSAPPPQDGGVCANTPTSCGAPGHCESCVGSSQGGACVGGACGCNGPGDCPVPGACQLNHTCGTPCAGPGECNGGCCSNFTCVTFDNAHCGVTCSPCIGATPTCGANGSCNGNCGGSGDGTCQTSCCNAGTCAIVGNASCGDYGMACVNCSTSSMGSVCEITVNGGGCGCDGPGSSNQCPPGMSCYNKQCSTTCDGQHPCSTGCCSGNMIGTSMCVPNCGDAGMTCNMNYCQ